MNRFGSKSGFTLIELVVVILILSVLAGALVPRVTDRMASARDSRRMADMRTIRDAIEQYYVDKQTYPAPKKNGSYGGWDVSHDGNFVPDLVSSGYLREVPSDPLNDKTHHYRYYVLGIRQFEGDDAKAKNKGFFRCSKRDWSKEFDYVTGGGASWKN